MSKTKKAKRVTKGIQREIFKDEVDSFDILSQGVSDFVNPSPDGLYIGDVSLKKHLEDTGLGWVIGLRSFLGGLDWSRFASKYSPTGRLPIHPKIMMGLIIYGITEGEWSLRRLERLARKDVCAWYLCGGEMPDHSTIGNFITRHGDVLTDAFFEETLKEIAKRIRIDASEVAIGTNYNIKRFSRNILFDEKIGGTVHMAVGASYGETGGKNKSALHWDFIKDMKKGGKIFADGELIYENGKFRE